MISRVADGCFWLGRYLERAESMARLLATSRTLALDGWERSNEGLAADDVHGVLVRVVDETTATCDALGRELLGYGASG